MTTYKEIYKTLENKNFSVASGDSDETTIIVWDADKKEIEENLKGLHFQFLGTGYGGGFIIAPKEDK